MKIKVLLLFTIVIAQLCFAQYPQDYFRSPLDIPLILSGTFGELRSNHFHTGIDIKTQGAVGKNVYAAADGYISRIKVSPWGYGNAIYIAHPNGYTTVYGHLHNFNETITHFVRKKQYERKSFEVDIYLKAGELTVKKGDVFSYSGNSGGSGGPHLHFEIRKTNNSKPINPLLFGFDVPDHKKPTVAGVYFYKFDPLNPDRYHLQRKHLNVTPANDTLYNLGNLKSYGTVGFALHTYDRLDNASNKNGPYTISFFIDGKEVHQFKAETLSFSENRFLNAHIDYDLYKNDGPKVNRCYSLDGNRLSMYPVKQNSLLTLDSSITKSLLWKITDVAGNKSYVTGTITGIGGKMNSSEKFFLPYNQDNKYQDDNISMHLPKGCLYQSVPFEAKTVKPCYNGIGQGFKIGDKGVPLHKNGIFKIKVTGAEGLDKTKLVAVRLNNNCKHSSEGGTYNNGWLTFKTRQLGNFGIMIDTIAPVIKPLTSKKSFKKGNYISFKGTDDLSGIDKYNATIDGNWVLLQYDPKKAKFYYECEDRLAKGKHEFEIKLIDERKNLSTFTFVFEYL